MTAATHFLKFEVIHDSSYHYNNTVITPEIHIQTRNNRYSVSHYVKKKQPKKPPNTTGIRDEAEI